MCGGSPPPPPTPAKLPDPVPAPAAPEETGQAPQLQEGGVGSSESEKRRYKSQGTRSLRIPLGVGDEEATGLNIPV